MVIDENPTKFIANFTSSPTGELSQNGGAGDFNFGGITSTTTGAAVLQTSTNSKTTSKASTNKATTSKGTTSILQLSTSSTSSPEQTTSAQLTTTRSFTKTATESSTSLTTLTTSTTQMATPAFVGSGWGNGVVVCTWDAQARNLSDCFQSPSISNTTNYYIWDLAFSRNKIVVTDYTTCGILVCDLQGTNISNCNTVLLPNTCTSQNTWGIRISADGTIIYIAASTALYACDIDSANNNLTGCVQDGGISSILVLELFPAANKLIYTEGINLYTCDVSGKALSNCQVSSGAGTFNQAYGLFWVPSYPSRLWVTGSASSVSFVKNCAINETTYHVESCSGDLQGAGGMSNNGAWTLDVKDDILFLTDGSNSLVWNCDVVGNGTTISNCTSRADVLFSGPIVVRLGPAYLV